MNESSLLTRNELLALDGFINNAQLRDNPVIASARRKIREQLIESAPGASCSESPGDVAKIMADAKPTNPFVPGALVKHKAGGPNAPLMIIWKFNADTGTVSARYFDPQAYGFKSGDFVRAELEIPPAG